MTELHAPARTADERTHGPVVATFRFLARSHLRLAAWVVVILVVVVAIAILLIDRFGAFEYSILGFARQAMVWFPFSLGIAVSTTHLPACVAMGTTRRSLLRATVLVGITMSAVYAVAMVALIQLERIWYHALGWQHAMSQGLTALGDTSQVGNLLVEYLLLALAGHFCGLLVGIVYYRTGGWWWGTVTLPLTVGPILLVQMGVEASLWGIDASNAFAIGSSTGLAMRALVLGAVLLVVTVVYGLVLRTTPVQSTVA